MEPSVGRGVIVLTISGILCKIIGAFFRLPLTYILGVEGIGIFQLVMSVFSFALVLTSGGLPVTLSKLISAERAKGNFGKIKWYIYIALGYSILVSFLIGVLFLLFSRPLAVFQQSEGASVCYKLFFPLLLFSSLVSLYRGVFQGYEDMVPTAVSQIIEQLCKFVFGLILAHILARYSITYGVLGAILGIVLGEVLAVAYLLIKKKNLGLGKNRYEIAGRKEFFSYFFPATLGLSVSSFVHFFDSLVINQRLARAGISAEAATSLFGLQTGVVGSILNFPIIISLSLATALLPTLSFEKGGDEKRFKQKISKSFSLMWFVILPITFGLLAVSLPLYQVVYPFFSRDMFSYAVRLTAIGSISTILLAVAQFCTSILHARGEFRFVFISYFLGGGIKIICTLLLCPLKGVNILGLAIGNAASSLAIMLMCLTKLRREILVGLDLFFAPLLSSLVMLVVTGYLSVILPVSSMLNLIICVIIGVAIYVLLTLPLIKCFICEFMGKIFRKRLKDEQERNA